MIKNFVVKVKQVQHQDRGLKNLLNYLEDKKRHPGGIIKIKKFSKDNFFRSTILNITEYNLNKTAGRKTKNYADSFIFTIPPQYQQKSTKKLKKILNNLVNDIYLQFNSQLDSEISKENFLKQIYINIHTDKKHIHFNVLFPRVIKTEKGLVANRITNRKKFLYQIKNKWTYNLTKNLNISIEDYKQKTKFNRGYKKAFLKKEIEKIMELNELLTKQRKEIKEALSKLEEKNKEKEEIVKKMTLVIRYYKKFKEYIDKQEKEKAKQEYFKAKNKIKQIEKHKLGKTTKKILNQIKGDLNSYDFGM